MDWSFVWIFVQLALEELISLQDYLLDADRLFYIITAMLTFTALAAAYFYHKYEVEGTQDQAGRATSSSVTYDGKNQSKEGLQGNCNTLIKGEITESSGKKREVRQQTNLTRQDYSLYNKQRKQMKQSGGYDKTQFLRDDNQDNLSLLGSNSISLINEKSRVSVQRLRPTNFEPRIYSLSAPDVEHSNQLDIPYFGSDDYDHGSESGSIGFEYSDYFYDVEYDLTSAVSLGSRDHEDNRQWIGSTLTHVHPNEVGSDFSNYHSSPVIDTGCSPNSSCTYVMPLFCSPIEISVCRSITESNYEINECISESEERVNEAQYVTSTMSLIDTPNGQQLTSSTLRPSRRPTLPFGPEHLHDDKASVFALPGKGNTNSSQPMEVYEPGVWQCYEAEECQCSNLEVLSAESIHASSPLKQSNKNAPPHYYNDAESSFLVPNIVPVPLTLIDYDNHNYDNDTHAYYDVNGLETFRAMKTEANIDSGSQYLTDEPHVYQVNAIDDFVCHPFLNVAFNDYLLDIQIPNTPSTFHPAPQIEAAQRQKVSEKHSDHDLAPIFVHAVKESIVNNHNVQPKLIRDSSNLSDFYEYKCREVWLLAEEIPIYEWTQVQKSKDNSELKVTTYNTNKSTMATSLNVVIEELFLTPLSCSTSDTDIFSRDPRDYVETEMKQMVEETLFTPCSFDDEQKSDDCRTPSNEFELNANKETRALHRNGIWTEQDLAHAIWPLKEEIKVSSLTPSQFRIKSNIHSSQEFMNNFVPQKLWDVTNEAERSFSQNTGSLCKTDSNYSHSRNGQNNNLRFKYNKDEVKDGIIQVCSERKEVNTNTIPSVLSENGRLGTANKKDNNSTIEDNTFLQYLDATSAVKELQVYNVSAVCQGELLEAFEFSSPAHLRNAQWCSSMGQLLCVSEPLPSSFIPYDILEDVDVTIVHSNEFAVVNFTNESLKTCNGSTLTNSTSHKNLQQGLDNVSSYPKGNDSSDRLPPTLEPTEFDQYYSCNNEKYYDVAKTRIILDEYDGHFVKTEINEKNRQFIPAESLNSENGNFARTRPEKQFKTGTDYEERIQRFCVADTVDSTKTRQEEQENCAIESIFTTTEPQVEVDKQADSILSEDSQESDVSSDDENVYSGDVSLTSKHVTYISDKDILPLRTRLSTRVCERLKELAERYREQEIYGIDGKGFILSNTSTSDETSNDAIETCSQGNEGVVSHVDDDKFFDTRFIQNIHQDGNLYNSDSGDKVDTCKSNIVVEKPRGNIEVNASEGGELENVRNSFNQKILQSSEIHVVEDLVDNRPSLNDADLEPETRYIDDDVYASCSEGIDGNYSQSEFDSFGRQAKYSDLETAVLRVDPIHCLSLSDSQSESEDWHSACDLSFPPLQESDTHFSKSHLVYERENEAHDCTINNLDRLDSFNVVDTSPLTAESGYFSAEVKEQVFTYDSFYVDVKTLNPEIAVVTSIDWFTPHILVYDSLVEDSSCQLLESKLIHVPFDQLRKTTVPGKKTERVLDQVDNSDSLEKSFDKCDYRGSTAAKDIVITPNSKNSEVQDKEIKNHQFSSKKDRIYFVDKTAVEIQRIEPRGLQLGFLFSVLGKKENSAGDELAVAHSRLSRFDNKASADNENANTVLSNEPSVPRRDVFETQCCLNVVENEQELKDAGILSRPDENLKNEANRFTEVNIEDIGSKIQTEGYQYRRGRSNSSPPFYSTERFKDMACFGQKTPNRQLAADQYLPKEGRLRKTRSAEHLRKKKVLSLLCGSKANYDHQKRFHRTFSDDVETQTDESFLLSYRQMEGLLPIPAVLMTAKSSEYGTEPRCIDKGVNAGTILPANDDTTINRSNNNSEVLDNGIEGENRHLHLASKRTEVLAHDHMLERTAQENILPINLSLPVQRDSFDKKSNSSVTDLSYLIKDTRGDFMESDVDDFPPLPLFVATSDSLGGDHTSEGSQLSLTSISSIQSQTTVVESAFELEKVDEPISHIENFKRRSASAERLFCQSGERLDDIRADYWHRVNILANSSTNRSQSFTKTNSMVVEEDVTGVETSFLSESPVSAAVIETSPVINNGKTRIQKIHVEGESPLPAKENGNTYTTKIETDVESKLPAKRHEISQRKQTDGITQLRNFIETDPAGSLNGKEKPFLERKEIYSRDTKQHKTNSNNALNFWKNLENNHSPHPKPVYQQTRITNSGERNVAIETRSIESGPLKSRGELFQTDGLDEKTTSNNFKLVSKDQERKKRTTSKFSTGIQISKAIGSKVSKFFKGDKIKVTVNADVVDDDNSKVQNNKTLESTGMSHQVTETKEPASEMADNKHNDESKQLVVVKECLDSSDINLKPTDRTPSTNNRANEVNRGTDPAISETEATERPKSMYIDSLAPCADLESMQRSKSESTINEADFISDSDELLDNGENVSEEVVYQEESPGTESLFYVLGSFRRKYHRPHALKRSHSMREKGLRYQTEYKEQGGGTNSLPGSPRVSVSERPVAQSEDDSPAKVRSRTPIMYRRTTSSEGSLWRSKSENNKYGFTVAVVSSRSGSVASNYSDIDGGSSVASSGFWGHGETSIDDFNEECIDRISLKDEPNRTPTCFLETDLDSVIFDRNINNNAVTNIGSPTFVNKDYLSPTARELSPEQFPSSSTVSLSGEDSSCSADSLRRKSLKTITVRNWPADGEKRTRKTKRRSRPKTREALEPIKPLDPSLTVPGSRRPIVSGRVPSPAIGLDYKDLYRQQHDNHLPEKGVLKPSALRIVHHDSDSDPNRKASPDRKPRSQTNGIRNADRNQRQQSERKEAKPHRSRIENEVSEAILVAQESATLNSTPQKISKEILHPYESLNGIPDRHKTVRPTPLRLSSHSSSESYSNIHEASSSPARSQNSPQNTLLENSFRPIPPTNRRSSRDQGGHLALDEIETDGLHSDDGALFSDTSYFDSVGLFDEGNSSMDRLPDNLQFLDEASPHTKSSDIPFDDIRNKQKEVICAYPMCDKVPRTLLSSSSSYSSCIACFTYYCSRECRRADWPEHKRTCYYGRVHFYVKALVRRLEEDPGLSLYFSQMAVDNFRSRGRGVIVTHFSSPMALKLFLIERTNVFPQAPIFLSHDELDQDEVVRDRENHLLQFVYDYHVDTEYVVSITVAIGDHQQQNVRSAESRLSSNIVRRCITLKLHSDFVVIERSSYSPSAYEIRTFTLPKVNHHDFANDMEARRHYCGEIARNLRRCGVYLKRDYPEEYHLLCLYVERNLSFDPLTLFGSCDGKTFKCIVFPEGYEKGESSVESSETGVLI